MMSLMVGVLMSIAGVLAQCAQQPEGGGGGGTGGLIGLWPIVLIFVIFYFLLISRRNYPKQGDLVSD